MAAENGKSTTDGIAVLHPPPWEVSKTERRNRRRKVDDSAFSEAYLRKLGEKTISGGSALEPGSCGSTCSLGPGTHLCRSHREAPHREPSHRETPHREPPRERARECLRERDDGGTKTMTTWSLPCKRQTVSQTMTKGVNPTLLRWTWRCPSQGNQRWW